MVNKSFIFIAGHHRSGTSLLHEIIREHPRISGFSNTGAPEDEGQHLQSVYKPARAFGGPGKYIFNKNSYMNENHSLATPQSAEQLLEQWEIHYNTECTHYVEKSPPNLVRTRFLQKLFPNSKFVCILRHPLAVSYATQKWAKTPIETLIEHTLIGYEILFKDIKHLNNAYVLRYEDFAKNPQDEIDQIYDFLNLNTSKVKHLVKPSVNNKYFSMWDSDKTEILRKRPSLIIRQFEERANKFGYSIRDYNSLLPSSLLGAHAKSRIQP